MTWQDFLLMRFVRSADWRRPCRGSGRRCCARLDAAADQGVRLKISGHQLEDDWLYVVVTPVGAGTRGTDHARLLSQVERDLREQGIEQVLLVPSIDD